MDGLTCWCQDTSPASRGKVPKRELLPCPAVSLEHLILSQLDIRDMARKNHLLFSSLLHGDIHLTGTAMVTGVLPPLPGYRFPFWHTVIDWHRSIDATPWRHCVTVAFRRASGSGSSCLVAPPSAELCGANLSWTVVHHGAPIVDPKSAGIAPTS